MKETIGFIGLGIMGKPMATNLLKAGYPLVAHNRSREPVRELVSMGAQEAFSPKEVASRSDVIITMLPDTPDVELVALGENGIIEGIRPGSVYIDMSTISPVATRRIAQEIRAKGAEMLDAPVSGGQVGAINATLSIMVGGRKEVFERCLPIFQTMGKNIVYMGESGAGQVTKACNQIVVALTIEAVGEALLLAAKAGVDPARVREALLGGFAQSRILDLHGKRILERNFEPGFKARLHLKDLGIALGTGKAAGVPLPLTAMVHEMFNALVAGGKGELDHSALVTVLEHLAGQEVQG